MSKMYMKLFAILTGVSMLATVLLGAAWAVLPPPGLPIGWGAIFFFVMTHIFGALMVIAKNLGIKPSE